MTTLKEHILLNTPAGTLQLVLSSVGSTCLKLTKSVNSLYFVKHTAGSLQPVLSSVDSTFIFKLTKISKIVFTLCNTAAGNFTSSSYLVQNVLTVLEYSYKAIFDNMKLKYMLSLSKCKSEFNQACFKIC